MRRHLNHETGMQNAQATAAEESLSAFRRLRSSGFTLLEVVVALALTLLLLTAVYGALRLQYRISTAGREQMERAQLARAVLRQIESDIRSVVWQVQKPSAAKEQHSSSSAVEEDTTGGATSSSTDETLPMQFSEAALTGASSGIFGDSQNLVLHISRPSRSLVYATSLEEAAGAERSDQASVSYFLADGGAGGLSAAVAQQHGGGSSLLAGVLGLARLEGDRLTLEQAGANDAVDSLASSAQLLAPEVVAVEFAYWDGLEWLTSWDSVASGALPSAIGITLSIDMQTLAQERTVAGRLQQSLRTGESPDSGQPVTVRYVVAVPLAEPYVGEAIF